MRGSRSAQDDQGWFHYRSQRKGTISAGLDASYRPRGDRFQSEPGTLTHWLTARYCLYAGDRRGSVFRGEIDHPPWPLQDAEAIVRCNTLTDWLDIALPDQPPLLHFARDLRVVAWTNTTSASEWIPSGNKAQSNFVRLSPLIVNVRALDHPARPAKNPADRPEQQ